MIRFLSLVLFLVVPALAQANDVVAPDYSQDRYWSHVESLPAGMVPEPGFRQVDVFWIHPTTTRSTAQINHDPLDPAVVKWTEESAVQRQASAFTGCCRVFAPRYRAATTIALSDPAKMKIAFELAYSDIERAFDWYLKHENKGRAFILAGHSQGAAHVASLLEKRIQGTTLRTRMVADYIIGINLMEGDLKTRFKAIPLCGKPSQTGCLIQWNTILADADPEMVLAVYRRAFAVANPGMEPGNPLCVNPVTFDTSQALSPTTLSKGAVSGAPTNGRMGTLRAQSVAAECRNGLLGVWLAPGLDLSPLPGGSMHFHDVGLFWADIAANSKARVRAWLRRNR